MFEKQEKGPLGDGSRGDGRVSAAGTASFIGPDLKVVGDLECSGDLQIEGAVEGNVTSRSVTLGETARVEGSVSADTARICGSLNGPVTAATVTIVKTAKVAGDIVHEILSIEPGAIIDGHCRRLEAAPGRGEAKVSSLKPAQGAAPKKAEPTGGAGGLGGADAGTGTRG